MRIVCFLFFIILCACGEDLDDTLTPNSLAVYTFNKTTQQGAVIACAGNKISNDSILAFFYPVPEASNYKIFATNALSKDLENYNNFIELELDTTAVFNGYLQRFALASEIERHLIISVEVDNEIKLSNPIKIKQISQPTLWNNEVTVNKTQPLMPIFSWQNNPTGQTAIYFQVLSHLNNDFISGTYTVEPHFQFYNLDNVVLNVTRQDPEPLQENASYQFTLMDVSEDNWINSVSEIQFNTQ